MLTYSRISSDTHGETLSEINLGEELNYLVTRQRTVLEESGLQIVLNLPLKPLHIPARRGLLEILLRNLLDNACKYTAQMDQPVLLNLFISSEGQPVLVVSNTALPIPAEHVDRLFEPYYRLPSAKQKGNGLGLAMAQDIAILHGWRLFLQQKRNEDRIELIVVFSP